MNYSCHADLPQNHNHLPQTSNHGQVLSELPQNSILD